VGSIRELSSGQTRVLEPEHIVGRASAPGCSQTLAPGYVSGVHAVFRWTGEGWELRDLNSRNGTYLDGQRLQPAGSLPVKLGSRIGFGTRAGEWEVVDTTGPEVMVVPLGGGDPVRLCGEMIPLPSRDDPAVTIYRGADGGWALERPDEPVLPLGNGHVFEAAGRFWRFCCCDLGPGTLAASGLDAVRAPIEVERLQLAFAVSRDEEHVQLRAAYGDRRIDLGAHSYHYLLLTLARQRLQDAAEGLPDTSCGWVDIEDLARDPSMAPPRLNIDVFRIREQFESVGVVDAPKIVERRARPRQLRIGTPYISIEVL
jgi:hypothetical protein